MRCSRFFFLMQLPILRFSLCLVLAGLSPLWPGTAAAQGNLLITPRRLVFEGARRSQELNLANTGKDTARYLISLIEIEMKEDGSFVILKDTDTGRNYASPYLRYFPRSVTLAPNEAQTLKVQLVNAGQLEAGEYRSHFYFRAIPNQAPLGEQDTTKDSSISVSIVPIFGISIPAIIRVGTTSATAAISNTHLEIKDKEAFLSMTFHRTGNMSVYGNLTVEHITPNGKSTPAGLVKGLAIYTPNARRQFILPLESKSGIDYHSGKLRLLFQDSGAGNVKLAETELELH